MPALPHDSPGLPFGSPPDTLPAALVMARLALAAVRVELPRRHWSDLREILTPDGPAVFEPIADLVERLESAARILDLTGDEMAELALVVLPEEYADNARPPAPTSACPGSEVKTAVMEARAARGEGLWHPLDGRYQQPGRPARRDRAGNWRWQAKKKAAKAAVENA
jgi:hypothetical protein